MFHVAGNAYLLSSMSSFRTAPKPMCTKGRACMSESFLFQLSLTTDGQLYMNQKKKFRELKTTNGVGNYATWESAVMGFGAVGELKALRQQIRAAGKTPEPPIIAGPRPRKVEGFAWDSRVNAYIVPFPGMHSCLLHYACDC
jgi:hypothetical protein